MSTVTWLTGTWFIISTNFPMWIKGDKQNPQFHYSLAEKHGRQVDKVTYLKKGKARTITGYDRPHANNALAFTWRGKGLLAIASSEWEIRLVDAQKKWAVIFQKHCSRPMA